MLHNMLRAAAGRDRIPTDGLVAWYTMDNISGSTLVDEMGTYDGTITGATQVSGVIGQALNFDGNDIVTTSAGTDVTSGNLTVSLWLNTAQTSSAYPLAFGDANGTEQGLLIVSGGIVFHARLNGGGYIGHSPIPGYQDGAWHHVIGLIEAGVVSTIIDNFVQDSKTPSSINNRTNAMNIGRSTRNAYWYNGAVDMVRIYNRALSGPERSALYNEGA